MSIQANSIQITELIPYPAVDGGSCLHQEVDTGLQLFTLVLKIFLLLLRQCLATLPEQGVVGQNSTVQWGMAWKTKYRRKITTVPTKTSMYREEARAGRESVCISAHVL